MKTTIKYIIPFLLFFLNVNCDSAEKELSEPEKNFEFCGRLLKKTIRYSTQNM